MGAAAATAAPLSTITQVAGERYNPGATIPHPKRDQPLCRVIGLLGAGSFGEVYGILRRGVTEAMKCVHLDDANGDTTVLSKDTDREYELCVECGLMLGLAPHSNVVNLAFCMISDRTFFVFMDLVDGSDLEELIKQNPEALYGDLACAHLSEHHRQLLFSSKAVNIAAQLASALHHCHVCGIMHEDVKPGNVMVTRRGVIKLADFGCSAIALDEGRDEGLRVFVEGFTPTYISPEVEEASQTASKGRDASLSPKEFDNWAWGLVVLELFLRWWFSDGKMRAKDFLVDEILDQVESLRSFEEAKQLRVEEFSEALSECNIFTSEKKRLKTKTKAQELGLHGSLILLISIARNNTSLRDTLQPEGSTKKVPLAVAADLQQACRRGFRHYEIPPVIASLLRDVLSPTCERRPDSMKTAVETCVGYLQRDEVVHSELAEIRRAGHLPQFSEEQLKHIESDRSVARINLGTSLMSKGYTEEALSHYREAVNLDEQSVEAWYNCGVAYRTLGQNEKAEEAYNSAIASFDSGDHDEFANIAADACCNLGRLRHSDDDHKEAEDLYRRAQEISAPHEAALNNLATLLTESGRHDEASKILESLVQHNPESCTYRRNYAVSLQTMLDLKSAQQQYSVLVGLLQEKLCVQCGLAPSTDLSNLTTHLKQRNETKRLAANVDALYTALIELGKLLLDAGRGMDAYELFEAAHTCRTERPLAPYYTGKALAMAKGSQERVVELFETAIESYTKAKSLNGAGTLESSWSEEISPVHWADMHRSLGRALANQGKPREALVAFFRSMEIDEDDGLTHSIVAIIYHGQGEYTAALSQHEQAVRLSPENPQIFFAYGKTLLVVEEYHAALEAFARAVALDPPSLTVIDTKSKSGFSRGLQHGAGIDCCVQTLRLMMQKDVEKEGIPQKLSCLTSELISQAPVLDTEPTFALSITEILFALEPNAPETLRWSKQAVSCAIRTLAAMKAALRTAHEDNMISKIQKSTGSTTDGTSGASYSANEWREAFQRAKRLVVDSYEMCAQTQHYRGNVNEAIAMVRQALQLSKNDSYLLNFLADLYLRQQQVELATICLEQAAKCAKEFDAELYLRVASLYLELEAYDKAGASIRAILSYPGCDTLAEETVSNTLHLMTATHRALLEQQYFEVDDVAIIVDCLAACLPLLSGEKHVEYAPTVLKEGASQLVQAHEFLRTRDASKASEAQKLLHRVVGTLEGIDPANSAIVALQPLVKAVDDSSLQADQTPVVE